MGILITERERSNGTAEQLITNTYIPDGGSIDIDVKQSDGYSSATNEESISLSGGFGEENSLSEFESLDDGYYWFEIETSGEIEIDKITLETDSTNLGLWEESSDWNSSELLGARSAVDSDSLDHEYQYGSLTKGLVGYWRFDEGAGTTAKDSALDNDGEINGASYVDGKIGEALDFDSSNGDFVEVPQSELGDDGTICMWVNVDEVKEQLIFHHDTGNDDRLYIWLEDNGDIDFGIAGSTKSDSQLDGVYSYTDDEGWVFLSLSWNDGEWVSWKDDNRESDVYSGEVATSNEQWQIATRNKEEKYFDGRIDELRIYDRALSQGEIEALYELDKPTEITDRDRLYLDLEAWYPLNEEDGDAFDIAGDSDGSNTSVDQGEPGLMGSPAYGFDGTDSYIDSDLTVDSPNTSISCWINPDNDGVIVSDNVNSRIEMSVTGDTLDVDFNDGSANTLSGDLDSDWNHVSVSIEDDAVLYINGSQKDTIEDISDLADSDSLNIGRSTGDSDYYEGLIQDVRIHSRGISSGEVEELYSMGEVDLNTVPTNEEIVSDGLVSFWPLNELDGASEAQDVVGDNNGTIEGATPGYNGVGGQRAYDFDGSDDYINTNYAPSNLEGKTFTVWVNTTVTSGDDRIIAARDGDAINIKISDGVFEYNLEDDGTFSNLVGSNISDGEWHFVVGSWDGENHNVYVDGILDATEKFTGSVTNIPDLYIGAWNDAENNTVNNYFTGKISQVRIYDRALTQQEVWRLYDQGRLLQGEIL